MPATLWLGRLSITMISRVRAAPQVNDRRSPACFFMSHEHPHVSLILTVKQLAIIMLVRSGGRRPRPRSCAANRRRPRSAPPRARARCANMVIPAIIMLVRSGGRRPRPRSCAANRRRPRSAPPRARARDARTWLSRWRDPAVVDVDPVVAPRSAPEQRGGRVRARVTRLSCAGIPHASPRRP